MIIINWYFLAGVFVSAIILGIVLKLLYRTTDKRCTQCNKESEDLVKQVVHYSHRKVDGSYNPNGGFKTEMLCRACRENGFNGVMK